MHTAIRIIDSHPRAVAVLTGAPLLYAIDFLQRSLLLGQ